MNDRAVCSDLTRDFTRHQIDGRCFRHANHVQVAFEVLGSHDFIDAIQIYCRGVQSMAEKAGVPDKFNVTITIAFLSLIAERMAASDDGTFADFVERNPDLMSKNVLAAWYAPDRLMFDGARTIFLMPQSRRPG